MSFTGISQTGQIQPGEEPGKVKPRTRTTQKTRFDEQLRRAGQLRKDRAPEEYRQLEAIKSLAVLYRLHMNTALLRSLADSPGNESAGTASRPRAGSMWWPDLIKALESLRQASPKAFRGPGNPLNQTDRESVPPPEPSGIQPLRQDFDALIEQIAAKNGLDANLVKAVIKAESDFDPMAVSGKGAGGLMQIMPETAKDLGVQDPFDPAQNIDGGCRYLKQMLNRYSGDLNRALAAYNWGPGNLDRSAGKLPEETRTYIKRVNRFYNQFTATAKA